ncbi:MAG: hypothetical protein AAF702_33030 [Chloroflexota bacterium]
MSSSDGEKLDPRFRMTPEAAEAGVIGVICALHNHTMSLSAQCPTVQKALKKAQRQAERSEKKRASGK